METRFGEYEDVRVVMSVDRYMKLIIHYYVR